MTAPSARNQLVSETRRLLAAYNVSGEAALRNRIVVLNRRLVLQVAGRVAARSTLEFDDLVQIGHLGLIKAVERFNPATGHAFSSFAVPLIRGEILHYIRDHSTLLRMSRRLQEIHSRGSALRQRSLNESGNNLTDQQISEQLAITPERWREACLAHRCVHPLSLDSGLLGDDDEPLRLVDALATPSSEEDEADVCSRLRQLVANLDVDTRDLLKCCILDGVSRREMARRRGIPERRIARQLRQAIQQLQVELCG